MKSVKTFLIVFVTFWILIVMFRLLIVMDQVKSECPEGKVCMSKDEYEAMNRESEVTVIEPRVPLIAPTYTRERDLRVLNDPLYPAYNRTDRGTFESVIDNTLRRNINIPTQYYNDSYRLIGYVSNDQDEMGRWKLMGRQKDRNRGEFYMIPVNKNYDLKVQITDKMVIGEKLRDLDTLPDQIVFDSPLLAQTPYTFTELPKADLTDEIL